jgi:Protein of unknown function (DUF1553)/Protein of unknown function (DUF1549)/Planctomycete cytochrome C/Concanavalin A-like lectin/glucanases superfamily
MRQPSHPWRGQPDRLASTSRHKAWGAASLLVQLITLLPFCLATAIAGERPRLEYNRDVRPILAENCFACHGPDSAARKADLRLDRRDEAIKAGAITPGDTDNSELLARIKSSDPKELMPPSVTTKKLSPEQRDVLQRWIAEGAQFQPHWSLIPPKRPELPAVQDTAWAHQPIDRFVLAKLEAGRLRPAPQADRRTLARRLAIDLTGLPPAPAIVEAFVKDPAPDAYEALVTRFLDSPQWGEHRARYWLDSARYADTNGYHFDNFREAWAFRDWVINAFNRNLTFDRFTIEQLAGDLLPGSALDQQVASGFNRCNATTNEGGVIPEEYTVLYARDRTETVSQVWMGLTTGCAVCHDHKFDPISQREFYELSAFFNNTSQPTMDGNVKDTPPIVFVPGAADQSRWQSLSMELADFHSRLEARKQSSRADFTKWLAAADPKILEAMIPGAGLQLAAIEPTAAGSPTAQHGTRFESAGSGNFEKDHPFSFGAWIKVAKSDVFGSVIARMDDRSNYRGWDMWLEGGRIATHLVHRWPDNALKVVSRAVVSPGVWTHVFITYDGSARAAGVKIFINGEPQQTDVHADVLKQTIVTEVPLKVGQRHTGSRIDQLAVHTLRIYDRALSTAEAGILAGATRAATLLRLPARNRAQAEQDSVFAWWRGVLDPDSRTLREKLVSLGTEEVAIKKRGTYAHVMHERAEPAMAYLLHRGEYDKRRDPVKPDTPDALPPMTADLPKNRLGLAQWLVRPEHPLTARVVVNRFWQEVFGNGLVRTAGDFGVTGELPSHPELLDWLAVEFRESGWDVKRLFRMMVESSAYRQSAAATPEKREKDPQNRLLSRGPRFRMDGETIRDAALSCSGLLVGTLGGPSVRPYQPEGVWEAVAMPESNTHFYVPDHGDSLYRRSLYTFWKRSAPPASLDVFNAPTRETCTIRRERTNTPLQALVTLNDPQFVEAARALAQRVLKHGGQTDEDRIDFIARQLLARPFRPEEKAIVQASLARLSANYLSHPEEAAQLLSVGESKVDRSLNSATLAAWTMLANELMNLDEFLNK